MAGPGKTFMRLREAADAVNVTPLQAEQRLTRLRRKYGTPPKLEHRADPTDWVHRSEVEFLRLPPHAKLPDTRPSSLWGANVRHEPPRAPARPPTPKKPKPPRMCLVCNKTKPGERFPQKRFDVCDKCSPARRASVDLMDRALRGGSPGLGKRS